MKSIRSRLLLPLLGLSLALWVHAAETPAKTPAQLFSAAFNKLADIVDPPNGATPQTFSATLKVVKAEGWPKSVAGQTASFAYQAPDRLMVNATVDGKTYALGRNQQQLWIHAPAKKFGVVGVPGVPRFASAPDKKDTTSWARCNSRCPGSSSTCWRSCSISRRPPPNRSTASAARWCMSRPGPRRSAC